MKITNSVQAQKNEALILGVVFGLLWAYLWARAASVFYIHDEIITKWVYMISWNPLPYQGYVDANNHFLNSFLGGLFVRLFQSDSMLVVRLGSLLSFPLYFWSIAALRHFFKKRVNFYWLLTCLTCSAFLIEYFGLARGYGMSLAFLVFALQQTLAMFHSGNSRKVIFIVAAWILAVYANLTLIPFAFLGLVYISHFLWKKGGKMKIFILVLPALLLLGFAVKYSFHLKEIGKLYYGSQEGFFAVTVHSITRYMLDMENLPVDIALTVAAVMIFIAGIWCFIRSKNIHDPKLVFTVFFILSVLNILFQNWLLGINFPEDRAALYLIVFFVGAFCFTVDNLNVRWLAYPFIAINLTLFTYHINLEKSIFFGYEHFDQMLITKIPEEVQGLPPSTGARRDWAIDDEIMRKASIRFSPFQIAATESDTLQDYIIATRQTRPDLARLYHPVYEDKISNLILFERNSFLPRNKMSENSLRIEGVAEYTNIFKEKLDKPLFMRCSGYFEDINIFRDDPILVFSAQDSANTLNSYYQSINFIESCTIGSEGRLSYDFTFTMNTYPDADIVIVYLWNQRKINYTGEIKIEVYEIN